MNCDACNKSEKECVCLEDALVRRLLQKLLPKKLAEHLPNYKVDKRFAKRQNALMIIGLILLVIFALGCGITAAALIVAANIFTAGLPLYIAMGIGATATVIGNIYLLRSVVGAVLIAIFGKGTFMAGLSKTKSGETLPWYKIAFMVVGGLFAMSVGMTFGALTFSQVLALGVTLTFLGSISAAFPPLAIVLGIFAFTCMTALFFYGIASILQRDHILRDFKSFLKDLIDTDPNLERNKKPNGEPKHRWRIIIERAVTVTLLVLSLSLAGVGLVMAMTGCANGLANVLLQIPHAVPGAVYIASNVIALGAALVAQIPFTVNSYYLTINAALSNFSNPPPTDPNIEKQSASIRYFLKFSNIVLKITLLLKALCDGMLSATGSHHSIVVASIGGIAGTTTSFCGASAKEPEKPEVAGGKVNPANTIVAAGPLSEESNYLLADNTNGEQFEKDASNGKQVEKNAPGLKSRHNSFGSSTATNGNSRSTEPRFPKDNGAWIYRLFGNPTSSSTLRLKKDNQNCIPTTCFPSNCLPRNKMKVL